MKTAAEWTVLARIGLGIVGTLSLGALAQVHILAGLVAVGLWIYYAATYPPARVALFYVIGTTAGLILKEALQ